MSACVDDRRSGVMRLAAFVLVGLIVAGILVRFYRLGAQNFWLDELWTAAATDPALPLRRWLYDWILPDVHPPLYYLMLRPWREVFGGDEWALRLPSVILSAACVAVVPLVQRWTPFVRRPLALTAWFAASAGLIWFAQEARAYALFLLLAAAATCLSVALARRIEQGQPILGGAVALAAITLTLEYVHYFGVLVAAGSFGALVLFALATGKRRALPAIMAPGAAAILLFVPWLAFHLPHLAGKLGGAFWVTNNWTETFPKFAGFAAGSPVLFVAISALVIGALARRPQLVRRPDYFVPCAIMGIALIGAVAISLHTPVITARNLLVLLPPFYVVAIATLGDFEDAGGRWMSAGRLLPAVFATLFLGFAILRLATHTKDQWRDAAGFVAALPGCDAGTLPVNVFPKEVYGHYLPPGYRDRLVEVDVEGTEPAAVSAAELTHGPCPLILWAGHTLDDEVVDLWLDRLGLERRDVLVRTFKRHHIVLSRALPRPTADAPPAAPAEMGR